MTVLDTAGGGIAGTAAVGLEPDAIAVAPNNKLALVANLGDNTVTPVSLPSLRSGAPIPVGAQPTAIAIAPNGSVALVTNFGDNTVTPISLPDLRAGAPIPTGLQPDAVAVTPDSKTALVANFQTSSVTPVLLSSMTAAASIAVGGNATGIAIRPQTQTAFVTGGNSLTPIDLATLQAKPGLAVGAGATAVAMGAGSTAWVTTDNGTVVPIDVATGHRGHAVEVGGQPRPSSSRRLHDENHHAPPPPAGTSRRGAALNPFADLLRVPVVQAPMAGGASGPELAAAVSEAGGLGFLAAGYKTAEQMLSEIADTRRRTSRPFGVNVFVPRRSVADPAALAEYLASLVPEATRLGADVGGAVWDDDDWPAKLDALRRDPVPVVSFTFGCPAHHELAALKRAGSLVVVTVTTPAEAEIAASAGVDGLALQGFEAGGHRGSFGDPAGTESDFGVLSLIGGVRSRVDLPLIAAGGIMEARDVAAVLAAGAVAAAMGTAFLRCPESGASPTHKAALVDPRFGGSDIARAFAAAEPAGWSIGS